MDDTNSLEDNVTRWSSTMATTPTSEFVFDDLWQRCIVAIAILTTSVFGIFGNSLVLFSVFASKKLRTVTNAFVVNLSTADLITSMFIPINAVVLINEQLISEWTCAISGGVVYTCVGCSLYTLASIAFNRLMLITRPMSTYNIVFSPFYTTIWIGITWLIPFCVIVFPPLFDIGELGINYKYKICGGKSTHPRKNDYDYAQAAGLYPVPLIIIVVSYSLTYHYLKKKTHKLTKKQGVSNSTFELETSVDGETSLPRNTAYTLSDSPKMSPALQRKPVVATTLKRRQHTITKNMFYVVVAYVLCLTPFAICLLFDSSEPVKPYASTLVLMNSGINPILYGFKHPYFREVFKCILKGKWHRVPEQSDGFRTLRERFCR